MTEITASPRPRISLDDKYVQRDGRVFMTGIQALVRLPLEQRRRDSEHGFDTAGYVTGYRGSPLGAYDQQLVRAKRFLDDARVVFNPAVNEDLAATACWGTQQAALSGDGAHDGVFAIWYGKGPGVDRSGDALRHGNLAGSSPLGGVLCLLGDDHTCESSTTSHHSEYAMVDAMIPVLNPAGVQEILDYGLYGIAMSRYSGTWSALKCVHDTVEAAASVAVSAGRLRIEQPDDHEPPEDGLHIRWPDTPQAQEKRLHVHKLEAVKAFARANRLDRVVIDSPTPRVGIVTTGKSYLDVRQALDDLDLDEDAARSLGLTVYKVAMPFPLEPVGVRAFCDRLDLVIVVEEKRALIETQLKDALYGRDGAPAIIGKRDEYGAILFPSAGRLDSNHIASVIGNRLLERVSDARLAERAREMQSLVERPVTPSVELQRTPYFCPGCPHSTSTRVPRGSRALAGIGCHYLAQFMDRETARYTQMGAEGASWIGEAPFSTRTHVFQNIGDGTYFHSGVLAIRAAIASGVNITFKILYNDAVAMTGGQGMDGPLSVPHISRQMHAEGARRIVVVTDEPDKYPRDTVFAPGTTVHHRDELDRIQRELREISGTTVLIYDQTCAAEKRRRRKRGQFPDPPRRVFINETVCEGCGDCGEKSNCLAVVPLETELGRKRAIDQSACNKDFSCLNGFCPSFVTVHGGRPRRGRGSGTSSLEAAVIPEPKLPASDRPYGIVITGVGGTGVVTIGALIGMAAHLDGRGCSILDQMGLAQKGGSVVSHVRIAGRPDEITATRIAAGGADLVLGGDLLTTAAAETMATLARGRSYVVANSHTIMTGAFTRDPDLDFPATRIERAIVGAVGNHAFSPVDATGMATALVGDAIAGNLFLLGFAWQLGRVPVSRTGLLEAIELNGVAVEMNKLAFEWGRRAACQPEEVIAAAFPRGRVGVERADTLDELTSTRVRYLRNYQDRAYAERYQRLVERVRSVERERVPGMAGLAEAVARAYFKLLAYKDEYEVARLYTEPAFRARLDAAFEGDYSIQVHLAPPLLARRDPNTGEPKKRAYGAWVFRVFNVLARLRRLRGTWLDPFGHTAERRAERELIARYEDTVEQIASGLSAANHAQAVALAGWPLRVRGFGHIKSRSIVEALDRESELLAAFQRPGARSRAA